MKKDPYLKLHQLSSELWNERKSLDWNNNPVFIARTLKTLDKLTKELKEIDFEKENNQLRDIYLPTKKGNE